MIPQLEGLVGVLVACPVCDSVVQVRATKTGKGMVRCDACKTLAFLNGPVAVELIRERMLPGQVDPMTGMTKIPFKRPRATYTTPDETH